MQQHPTLSTFLRLLWIAVLASVTPAGIAHAQVDVANASLPDAPTPQQSTTQTSQPATPPASTSTSNTGQNTAQDDQQKKKQTSDEILRVEEKQRAFGVMPMFQTVSLMNADNIPPMRPGQKFHLMLRSSTDPFVFALVGIVAGIGQARNTNTGTTLVTNPDGTTSEVPYGFGQGAAGYFKRFGAGYADTFDGNFWGNAVLPVLLKEDPRYYRKGTGSFMGRVSYAAAAAVWCRRDNGTWGPNYANVAGNFIAGGISNLYYPDQDTGFEKTVIGALTVTAEGVIGSELIEFLPDIEHHILKKHPKKSVTPIP